MSELDLNQLVRNAVHAEKSGPVADNIIEEFCRILKLDLATAKVVAYLCGSSVFGDTLGYNDREDVLLDLEQGSRQFVKDAFLLAYHRILFMRAIKTGSTIGVPINRLLPLSEADRLCPKCPRSLGCLTTQETTPQACYTERVRFIACTPIRLHEIIGEVQDPITGQSRHINLLDIERFGVPL